MKYNYIDENIYYDEGDSQGINGKERKTYYNWFISIEEKRLGILENILGENSRNSFNNFNLSSMTNIWEEINVMIRIINSGDRIKSSKIEEMQGAYRLASIAMKKGGIINSNDILKMSQVFKYDSPILSKMERSLLLDFSFYMGKVLKNNYEYAHWILNHRKSFGPLLPLMSLSKNGKFCMDIVRIVKNKASNNINGDKDDLIRWYNHMCEQANLCNLSEL